MSGTHGDPPESETQSGVSGLTNKNLLAHEFYEIDCVLVGIERGPRRVVDNLPINWEGVKESRETFRNQADISRKPKKMENPSDDSFAKGEDYFIRLGKSLDSSRFVVTPLFFWISPGFCPGEYNEALP